MSNIVTATFKDRPSSEYALDSLKNIGIKSEQISVVVTDEAGHHHVRLEDDSKADEGAIAGAAMGGIAGTVLSTMAQAGAMFIPGLNLVVSGPLVASLAGLGAGAFTGGLVGGLVGAGIPEHEAKIYEDEVKGGSVLLAVIAHDDKQRKDVKDVLKSVDALNIAA